MNLKKVVVDERAIPAWAGVAQQALVNLVTVEDVEETEEVLDDETETETETEPEPAKAEPEPAKAEPEPAKAEPEPAKAEPAKAEPAKAEPAKAEPGRVSIAEFNEELTETKILIGTGIFQYEVAKFWKGKVPVRTIPSVSELSDKLISDFSIRGDQDGVSFESVFVMADGPLAGMRISADHARLKPGQRAKIEASKGKGSWPRFFVVKQF